MKHLNFSKVAVVLIGGSLFSFASETKAGGEGFSQVDSKQTYDTKSSSDLGLGKFSSNPFHVSVTVRGGYDDNVDLSSVDPRGSAFANVSLQLGYDFGSPRTRINLTGGVSTTYYFDRGDGQSNQSSEDFAVNAWAGVSIIHKASPRLTLSANLSAAYLTRPGFDTFNNNLFIVDRRSQNYFQTTDKFTVAYTWAPRFATATSYTFSYIDYKDNTISFFEDRYEHVFGNEFRFLLTPTTTLVGEYRFGLVDYVADNNRGSYSQFFLAGFDHSFSPRFNVSLRAGLEVRSFDDNPQLVFGNIDDTQTAPYVEATVNYSIAQNTTISWFNRYSLEQPNVPDALARETYRTTLSLRHAFTSRISAALNVAYQHDTNQQTGVVNSFNEDSFDLGLSARYAINRTWAIDAGYQHTELFSPSSLFREFSRNQFYAGATFTW